jgi:pimeloyl-ACP methyl ester carboxylesterase
MAAQSLDRVIQFYFFWIPPAFAGRWAVYSGACRMRRYDNGLNILLFVLFVNYKDDTETSYAGSNSLCFPIYSDCKIIVADSRGFSMNISSIKRPAQFIFLLIVFLICACASLPNVITDQVGTRRVEYVLARHDTITVVFENGLAGTINTWAKVFPEISKDTSAFAYNRPGYGESDLVATPRDGVHVVDELRSLLLSKGLKPPYVLVGHSLGGLYMQLFARRYPNEVSALILVDSVHPDQRKGKGAPEYWPIWFRLAYEIAASAVEKEEAIAIDATGEMVLALPSFTQKPVIILSALKPMKEKSEFADDVNKKREDIARLYPGAKQIWVDSGHLIPQENPEAVISAIREVLSLQPSSDSNTK